MPLDALVDTTAPRLSPRVRTAARFRILEQGVLDHPDERDRMARAVSPFGDGQAARRIAERIARMSSNRADG